MTPRKKDAVNNILKYRAMASEDLKEMIARSNVYGTSQRRMAQRVLRERDGRGARQMGDSPRPAREIFNEMYARTDQMRQAEKEAFLKTPEGERQRNEHNERVTQRMRDARIPNAELFQKYYEEVEYELRKAHLEIEEGENNPLLLRARLDTVIRLSHRLYSQLRRGF